MVSLIIDIALAIVALIVMMRHIRLGFVKSILGTFKPLIAGTLAFVFRVPVAKLFRDMYISLLDPMVNESLTASSIGAEPSFDIVSLYNGFPIVYEKILSFFGLDLENGFRDSMANIEQLDEVAIAELSLNISSAMAWGLSLLSALLAVFIIALIVLSIITSLLDLITKIPVFNVVNRILGAAIGLFWASAFALLIGVVLTFASRLVPNVIGEGIISDSIILGLFSKLGIFQMVPGLS